MKFPRLFFKPLSILKNPLGKLFRYQHNLLENSHVEDISSIPMGVFSNP
jgi:hypothetical protein